MGECRDAISGPPKKKKIFGKEQENLITRMNEMREELSNLIQIKDDDTLNEGDDLKPENTRKAASLRAVHSLLTASKSLLEDY